MRRRIRCQVEELEQRLLLSGNPPQAILAINAGGGAVGNFLADADSSGGGSYTTSDAIDTSQVANPAPQAVYQSEHYSGNLNYSLPGFTPGTAYSVRLDFAEIWWNAPGERLFNVAINGQQVLNNFDVFATAGGKDRAIAETFTTTADSSGKITIQFDAIKDNAKVSGIEVSSVSSTPTSLAIHAGGGAVGSFLADTDFSGGTTYATGDAIDTSQVTSPAPQAVYQTERYGNFSYALPGLTAGASYTVWLDFAEIYWTAPGERLFNVAINGSQVLSSFDVFATAGGKDRAVAETFTTTADASGTITIGFVSIKDNAKVSGIEVSPLSTPPSSLAIHAGGGVVGSFLADTDFSGGATYATGDAINTSGVSNPAPQAVYQSERYGNFTYTLPGLRAGATYTVRLDFAEIWWNAPGQRLFNVTINGSQVLSNFDVFATAGGKDVAIAETFTSTADSSGKITIQFVTIKDNAKVSGIEVAPAASGPVVPAAPSGLAAAAGNGQVAVTWNAVPGATSYNLYRGTSKGGEGSVPVQTGLATASFTDTGLANGTAYFYVVTAVNSAGQSAASSEGSAVPTAPGSGTTYYVSPGGNDSNDGRSPATAWRTVAWVNSAVFQPGDTILFQRGGEWHESLRASSSGTASAPITYGAYGSGAKPIFWGSDALSNAGFQPAGGTVYTITEQNVGSVLVYHQFLLAAPDLPSVLSQPGTWFLNGSTLYVNTGGSDPRSDGNLYTACVRVDAVYSNGQNHLVFEDLVAEETANVNDGYCFRVMGSDDVRLIDDEAYRGGRHNFGVINSTNFVGQGLYATYAMPAVPGGATFYVSFSDDSRSGDTHSWINCTADHLEDGQGGHYLAWYDHGNGLGAILIQNMVSHGGMIGIGQSSPTTPVTIKGGEIDDASLENFGTNLTVDGLTLKGNAAIDNYGSNNLFENMLLVVNPVNGGPTGYWSAIVMRSGVQNNTVRFCTVALDPSAVSWATCLALVGKGSETNLYGNVLMSNGPVIQSWAGSLDRTDLALADYNFYNAGATFVNSSGQGTTLAAWQAAGFDTHSLSGNPLFTNPAAGDYSLQASSPAINATLVGSGLVPATDILGHPRNDGTPDMGAYEFQKV